MIGTATLSKAATPAVDGHCRGRYLFLVPPPAATALPEPLSATRRATLTAAASRIVPHAFAEATRGEALISAIAARIQRLPPPKRRDFEMALDLLGNRWATLATGHHPLPFHLLAPEEQDRLLQRWSRSRVGALKTIVQAVRLFSLYRGAGLPAGSKSLAFRVVMQHTERTLTDAEADAARDALVALLGTKFSASLRK